MAIRIEDDIPHVRKYPGMYIGNTYSPDRLMQEVLDNSLDEKAAGFASTVTVDIPEPGHIIITDDGRGIEVHPIDYKGEILDSIIAVCTVLKSGEKFDGQIYNLSIGMHGIGLVAVNALSLSMTVSVKDRKNKKLIHHYQFEDSVCVEQKDIEFDVSWSTRVEFIVNPKYFTTIEINRQKISDQLTLVQSKFPKGKLFLDGKEIPKIRTDEFVRLKLNLDPEIPLFKVEIPANTLGEMATVYFTYDATGGMSPEIYGDVNLHICSGTYLSNFQTIFANAIIDKYGVSKNEAMSYFRGFVDLMINNPQYDSQAKINMTKNISPLLSKARPSIDQLVSNSFFKGIVNSIINEKTLKKAAKKIVKRGRVKKSEGNPLKDCLRTPGDILYIMEGESADGSLGEFRDKYTEAILPISGKIKNVVGSNIEDVLNSKKFKYLLEALGVEIGKKQQTFRYKKVKILCDADPDGMHIAVLVLMGILYYAPQLIKERRISMILPPLYGASKGGKFVPIYDPSEIAKYPGWDINRFKGIGEMNPSQLEIVVKINPIEYVPTHPDTQQELDNIIRCISDTELKRKLCELKDKFNLSKLFPLNQK